MWSTLGPSHLFLYAAMPNDKLISLTIQLPRRCIFEIIQNSLWEGMILCFNILRKFSYSCHILKYKILHNTFACSCFHHQLKYSLTVAFSHTNIVMESTFSTCVISTIGVTEYGLAVNLLRMDSTSDLGEMY